MISLCTVIVPGMEGYLKVLADTLKKSTRYVDEVLVAQSDDEEAGLDRTWVEGNIKYRLFSVTIPRTKLPLEEIHKYQRWTVYKYTEGTGAWMGDMAGHAFGLHACLDRAKNDYIWFCDPDVFYFNYFKVDEYFLTIKERLNLDLIGVSHWRWQEQCYLVFPTVINALVRKDKLPPADWLEGKLYVPYRLRVDERPIRTLPVNKWMIPGPIPDYYQWFPNPNGMFDTGCNLWLWAHTNKWRWLCFQLNERNFYSAMCHKKNFDGTIELEDHALLYHWTFGAHRPIEEYIEVYKKTLSQLGQTYDG